MTKVKKVKAEPKVKKTNVRTFDLEVFEHYNICAWPTCEDPASIYITRRWDQKKIKHCPSHHAMLVNHPKVRPLEVKPEV